MKLKSKITVLYVFLIVVYAIILFALPISVSTLDEYHITAGTLRLLDIAVFIPYALIWLVGFYGYSRLKSYSSSIKRGKDGRHINKLANGIFLLALWPSVSSITAGLALLWVSSGDSIVASGWVIANNYLNVLLPLVGFVLIGSATRGLNNLSRLSLSYRSMNVAVLISIIIGTIYGHLFATVGSNHPYYRLPMVFVLLTQVLPYIYMWYLGIVATYELLLYRRRVTGVIYRKSWGLLALGVASILVMQIIIQYTTTITTRVAELPMGWVGNTNYIILVILAVGYVLVARGASNLQKIEEV